MKPSTSLRNQRRVQAESVGEFMICGRNQTFAKQSMWIGPIGFPRAGKTRSLRLQNWQTSIYLLDQVAKMDILV